MAAGASGMGSMVKGKAGDWEERTDGIMQVLRTICLKCAFFLNFFSKKKKKARSIKRGVG